ncbi:cytochrome P450 [Microdochium bolleyi]|uniref:Cytochrome P450 n=1 Tax=Microdochium bolleyi TaxID=196109 RepID=A0A136IPE1_9PEZI|nr:cytochrome P450 [Microdochium bolleyi]
MAPQIEAGYPLAYLNDIVGCHSCARLKIITILTLIPLVLVVVFSRLFKPRMHPKEPQLVPSRIPFFGHNLSLLRNGPAAWLGFHMVQRLPIITLPTVVANGKMYMVTSPKLITSVFANPDLQFLPILTELIAPLAPLSARQKRDLQSGIFLKWVTAVPRMLSGEVGRGILHRTQHSFREQLESLISTGLEVNDIGLWIRNTMSRAILKGFLGDVSWASDQAFIQTVWDLEWNLDHFQCSPMPSVTASMSYKAREHAIDRIGAWLAAADQDPEAIDPATGTRRGSLSTMALELLAIVDDYPHWTPRDRGTLLLFVTHVALSNVVQTFFWTFTHIYADPELVAAVRSEAQAALELSITAGAHQDDKSLAALVQGKCPLLGACFQETQRLVTSTPIIRHVAADTIVTEGKGAQEYLLRRGAFLFVPRTVVHNDPEHWGSNAAEYRPQRFLMQRQQQWHDDDGEAGKSIGADAAELKAPKRGSFIPFGGGKEICPGRYISTSIILLTLAKLLTQVDIEPSEETPIRDPGPGQMQLTTIVWRIPAATGWRGTLRRRGAGTPEGHLVYL